MPNRNPPRLVARTVAVVPPGQRLCLRLRPSLCSVAVADVRVARERDPTSQWLFLSS